MSEKLPNNQSEKDPRFQERYVPEEVTLEELKERMRRVVEKEEGKE